MAAHFKKWMFFVRIQWPLILGGLLVLAAFWITLQFVEPPPPKHLTLAGGPKGGGYDYFAHRYAEELAKEGITVTILETKGSLENIRLLNDPENPVEVAFAQAGTGWMAGVYQESPSDSLVRSLAEIYDEPLWVFTRKQSPFAALRDLKGKRLAVGIEGSGVRALSVDLLKWSGVNGENSVFMEDSNEPALALLKEGKTDAIFFVSGPNAPLIRRCAMDPALALHSFSDAEAYSRRFPFLAKLVLSRSVLDFEKDLPAANVELVSPAATLLTRENLHPALAYLLLKVSKKIHGGHSIFSNAGDFPSIKNLEFPLQKEAARYFQSGPPLLQRYLPYHIAAFIDRTKILILPLLTLLIPLMKIAYPTYQWSVRRNIWKWYKQVNAIESAYHSKKASQKSLLARLQKLEVQVARLQVPFAYASELYTLRQHMVMVRKMIEKDDLRTEA